MVAHTACRPPLHSVSAVVGKCGSEYSTLRITVVGCGDSVMRAESHAVIMRFLNEATLFINEFNDAKTRTGCRLMSERPEAASLSFCYYSIHFLQSSLRENAIRLVELWWSYKIAHQILCYIVKSIQEVRNLETYIWINYCQNLHIVYEMNSYNSRKVAPDLQLKHTRRRVKNKSAGKILANLEDNNINIGESTSISVLRSMATWNIYRIYRMTKYTVKVPYTVHTL